MCVSILNKSKINQAVDNISRANKYLLKSIAPKIVLRVKTNLYHVFVLKCVSITNIGVEHYMERVVR